MSEEVKEKTKMRKELVYKVFRAIKKPAWMKIRFSYGNHER